MQKQVFEYILPKPSGLSSALSRVTHLALEATVVNNTKGYICIKNIRNSPVTYYNTQFRDQPQTG